jgi:hypothetical protein
MVASYLTTNLPKCTLYRGIAIQGIFGEVAELTDQPLASGDGERRKALFN